MRHVAQIKNNKESVDLLAEVFDSGKPYGRQENQRTVGIKG